MMMSSRTCPACPRDYSFGTIEEARVYAHHLENHLREGQTAFVKERAAHNFDVRNYPKRLRDQAPEIIEAEEECAQAEIDLQPCEGCGGRATHAVTCPRIRAPLRSEEKCEECGEVKGGGNGCSRCVGRSRRPKREEG